MRLLDRLLRELPIHHLPFVSYRPLLSVREAGKYSFYLGTFSLPVFVRKRGDEVVQIPPEVSATLRAPQTTGGKARFGGPTALCGSSPSSWSPEGASWVK